MAQGDATFARGNCDWPFDPRCQGLPDNDCRWLHEVMWRTAVKERRELIPKKYNPRWFCYAACLCGDLRFHECLKALVFAGLLRFNADHRIYVCGVKNNNPKLKWQEDEAIQLIDNPYLQDTGWIWGGYGWDTGGIRDPIKYKENVNEKVEGNINATKGGKVSSSKRNGHMSERQEEMFAAFWSLYPRKKEKEDARKAWTKAAIDEDTFAKIIEVLPSQAAEWARCDIKYVKYPARYINARKWQDELDRTSIPKSPGVFVDPTDEAMPF